MKCVLCAVLCLFLFCSCGIRTDFSIPCGTAASTESVETEGTKIFVIINKNSKKYHLDADCTYVARMSEKNRLDLKVNGKDILKEHGYTPCSKCSSD